MEQQLLALDTINIDKIADGLTVAEVKQRLLEFGRNYIAEKHPNRLILLLRKFWSPIPWMLGVTIILQLIIGKIEEAIVITFLLIFNSLLSFFQEERANKTFV